MGEDIVFLSEVVRRNPKVSFRDALFYEYTIGSQLQVTSNVRNFMDLPNAIKLIKKQNPSWGKSINDTGFLIRLALTWFHYSSKRAKFQSLGKLMWIVYQNPRVFLQFIKNRFFKKGHL
jgi:hypothetical protein